MKGYIQLIDKQTNDVLAQRVGSPEDVDYMKNVAWRVDGDNSKKVVFSESTDVADPLKVFRPVPKDTILHIYDDYLDDQMPVGKMPVWSGPAHELERSDGGIYSTVVPSDTWSTFTDDGEFIGTSEF
ncbi:hypothetical protein [Photobacterium ganghwense]|uniref:hypothetical protein n=1 Tax=Photobacterium ganghwense TaxID=320778 RepID=UPI001A8CA1F3|nr:hypothetical protein [Photobacterium ganghwense]QSV17635.1 hypothetical protein FH974_25435 [Photobacterium ganghwense]